MVGLEEEEPSSPGIQ
jgi:hypothetical protein